MASRSSAMNLSSRRMVQELEGLKKRVDELYEFARIGNERQTFTTSALARIEALLSSLVANQNRASNHEAQEDGDNDVDVVTHGGGNDNGNTEEHRYDFNPPLPDNDGNMELDNAMNSFMDAGNTIAGASDPGDREQILQSPASSSVLVGIVNERGDYSDEIGGAETPRYPSIAAEKDTEIAESPSPVVEHVVNTYPLATQMADADDNEDLDESQPRRRRSTRKQAQQSQLQQRGASKRKLASKSKNTNAKRMRRTNSVETISDRTSHLEEYFSDDEDGNGDVYEEESILDEGSIPSRRISTQDAPRVRLSKEEAEYLSNAADELRSGFFKENAACPTQVLKMFEDAALAGNLLAMLRAGEMYLNGAVSISPHAKAVNRSLGKAGMYFENLLKHEELKDVNDAEGCDFEIKVKALVNYGDVLFFKNGKKCNERAEKQYKAAAKMGDKYGQFKVGWLYYQKAHTAKTKKTGFLMECLNAWTKAVEMNSGLAASTMGTLYENPAEMDIYPAGIAAFEGREFSKEDAIRKAEMLFRRSSELECATGYNDLGGCYDGGFGSIRPDFERCVAMYLSAFEMGNITAAFNLGCIFEFGGSEPCFPNIIDNEKAIAWYTKGYLCECPSATAKLAAAYDEGYIVPKDWKKALALYQDTIKFCNRTNEHNETGEAAKDSLFDLCCASILMEEKCAKNARAVLNISKFAGGKRRLADARRIVAWLVCTDWKPKLYENVITAQKAPKDLEELLGTVKATDICHRIQSLCLEIRDSNSQEARQSLRILVGDPKFLKRLGI